MWWTRSSRRIWPWYGSARALINGQRTTMPTSRSASSQVSTSRKVRQIEAAKPTVLVINMINPWVINEVEPGAAAVLATFDIKAEALLDVVRGRFNPTGKLPITIPADQAAVDRNAPDVPGYAETFDYAYTNRVKDRYV